MAGLLGDIGDTIFGDTETKDESGQTERDRRAPLWSGLIKAGLLAYAGGGNLMPEDRAKYYSEAGGALAGIPNDMMQAAQGAAQNKLKMQQIVEGKQKLVDRDQVRAMANTPEVQAALAKASGPDKLAIIMALKSGDLHALTTAVGNLDKSGLNADRLQLSADKLKFLQEQAAKKAEGSFAGTGEAAQHWNHLQHADPSTFEYWAAYNYFNTDRTLPNGEKVGKLNLIGMPEPSYKHPSQGGGQTPDQIGQSLAPGEEKKLDNGTVIFKDGMGAVHIEYPGRDGQEGPRTRQEPNKPREVLAPFKPDPQLLRELTELKTAHAKVELAANDFISEWKKASTEDRTKSIAGLPTGVNSAWANLAALVKEKSVFNLGVLNGGDRAFITQAIADPSSIKSLGADPRIIEGQVRRIMNILEIGIKTHEKNTMSSPRQKTADVKSGAQQATGPDGKPLTTPEGKPLYKHSDGQLYLVPE